MIHALLCFAFEGYANRQDLTSRDAVSYCYDSDSSSTERCIPYRKKPKYKKESRDREGDCTTTIAYLSQMISVLIKELQVRICKAYESTENVICEGNQINCNEMEELIEAAINKCFSLQQSEIKALVDELEDAVEVLCCKKDGDLSSLISNQMESLRTSLASEVSALIAEPRDVSKPNDDSRSRRNGRPNDHPRSNDGSRENSEPDESDERDDLKDVKKVARKIQTRMGSEHDKCKHKLIAGMRNQDCIIQDDLRNLFEEFYANLTTILAKTEKCLLVDICGVLEQNILTSNAVATGNVEELKARLCVIVKEISVKITNVIAVWSATYATSYGSKKHQGICN
ncbi:hypothetical protein ECANGB1_1318 [Enterospora canceri]|uniref:Uncharacterized protein n=1 Tax=Enterospora canceri TaxID=1081671 RepID=A0A1Y1S719_9MICR|nr:hypothetical protein ECANGB1_1318 [Enterospora canceri]